MSAAITGPEPQTTNQQNPQVDPDPEQREREELTPDRPPQQVVEGEKPKRPRGFAAMDRKLVSEIARKGGKAAHSAGTAHEFTSEEARIAGRKGGRATHAKRRKAIEEQTGKTGE
jgi:uncharacterized protein